MQVGWIKAGICLNVDGRDKQERQGKEAQNKKDFVLKVSSLNAPHLSS